MGKIIRSRPRGHAHEQHLVVVRQCDGCARWVVLRGWTTHAAAFNNQGEARAAAKRVLRDIAGRPDPDPLYLEIDRTGHVAAIGQAPAEPDKAGGVA